LLLPPTIAESHFFAKSNLPLLVPTSSKVQKKKEERLFIAFWATRTVLNASTLSIRFHRNNDVEGLVYVLAMKDFLPQKR
jgi:hypothetical protein